MNMSLKEIYVWLSQLHLPSLAAIWDWLINAPWWLSIGSVLLAWFGGRLFLGLAWDLYLNACDAVGEFGGRLRKWVSKARDHMAWVREALKTLAARIRYLLGFGDPSKKSASRETGLP